MGEEMTSGLSTDTWTLANKITLGRILLVPVFAATYLVWGDAYPMLLVPLFFYILAAASDGLDGYFARSLNQRSELGSMLDPLADKFLLTVGLILVAFWGPPEAIPPWVVAAVLSRDILLVTGGILMRTLRGRMVVRPIRAGKLATCFQMTTVGWGMTQLVDVSPLWLNLFLWWGTALLTLYSGIVYGIHGCQQAADPLPRN